MHAVIPSKIQAKEVVTQSRIVDPILTPLHFHIQPPSPHPWKLFAAIEIFSKEQDIGIHTPEGAQMERRGGGLRSIFCDCGAGGGSFGAQVCQFGCVCAAQRLKKCAVLNYLRHIAQIIIFSISILYRQME